MSSRIWAVRVHIREALRLEVSFLDKDVMSRVIIYIGCSKPTPNSSRFWGYHSAAKAKCTQKTNNDKGNASCVPIVPLFLLLLHYSATLEHTAGVPYQCIQFHSVRQ